LGDLGLGGEMRLRKETLKVGNCGGGFWGIWGFVAKILG